MPTSEEALAQILIDADEGNYEQEQESTTPDEQIEAWDALTRDTMEERTNETPQAVEADDDGPTSTYGDSDLEPDPDLPQREYSEPQPVSPENIQRYQQWVIGQVNEIQEAFRSNKINKQQYDQAMQVADSHARDIQAMELSLREQAINQRDSLDKFNASVAEFEPKWAEPSNRKEIANRFKNFCADELCMSPQLIERAASDIEAIRAIHTVMKNKEAKRAKAKTAKLKRLRARKAREAKQQRTAQLPQQKFGTEGKVSAIADLLVGIGKS